MTCLLVYRMFYEQGLHTYTRSLETDGQRKF